MENKPYLHTFRSRNETNKLEWSGVFAIRLAACPVERIHETDRAQIAHKKIIEQMDFINALFSPVPQKTYALRYISKPNILSFSLGKIEIILFCKIISQKKLELSNTCLKHFNELMDLLGGLLPNYLWEPVYDKDSFIQFWNPVDWENIHLVEIVRRENQVRLETMRPRPSLGRSIFKENVNINDDETVYFINKFIPKTTSLARLIRTMLLQPEQVVLQVTISPVNLADTEGAAFEKELSKCEYEQLKAYNQQNNYLAHSETIHQKRAKDVADALFNQMIRLEDAPYLMKIYLLSEKPIPQSLVETVGIEITAPVGVSSASPFTSDLEFTQSGGYDTLYPKNEEKNIIATDNIKNLNFCSWEKSVAPKNLKRALFLVDALEAASAFRLPFADKNGLPGINLIATHNLSVPKEIVQTTNIDSDNQKVLIGENRYLGYSQKIYLNEQDRKQHVYVVGQTGTGKSSLLKTMIISDIENGNGVGVIDPHGDLFEEILHAIPKNRIKDVVILDPNDTQFPAGINMLEYEKPHERYFIIREARAIFERLFADQYGDAAYHYTGPMFYRHLQMNMLLAMSNPASPGTWGGSPMFRQF